MTEGKKQANMIGTKIYHNTNIYVFTGTKLTKTLQNTHHTYANRGLQDIILVLTDQQNEWY